VFGTVEHVWYLCSHFLICWYYACARCLIHIPSHAQSAHKHMSYLTASIQSAKNSIVGKSAFPATQCLLCVSKPSQNMDVEKFRVRAEEKS
jgi:hypothetical protein